MVVRGPAGAEPPGGAVCSTGPSYATVQPPGPGSWGKLAGAPPSGRQVPQGQPSGSCERGPVLPVPVPCLWKPSWPGPPLGGTSCAHPSEGRKSLLGSAFCGPAGGKPPGAKAAFPRKGGTGILPKWSPSPQPPPPGLPPSCSALCFRAGRPPPHPTPTPAARLRSGCSRTCPPPPPAHPTWPWRPE